jgi:DnaJ-class molecular chaperone
MKEKIDMEDAWFPEETPWPPTGLCPICQGYGRVYKDDDGTPDFEDDGTECLTCGGDGVVKE